MPNPHPVTLVCAPLGAILILPVSHMSRCDECDAWIQVSPNGQAFLAKNPTAGKICASCYLDARQPEDPIWLLPGGREELEGLIDPERLERIAADLHFFLNPPPEDP